MSKTESNHLQTSALPQIAATAEQAAAPVPAAEPNPAITPDPFDPEYLRQSQGFADLLGIKPLLLVVKVGKPRAEDWFRVNPDPAYQAQAALYEGKDKKEFYLVHPQMRDQLPGLWHNYSLYLTMTRQGVPMLWPIRMPDSDGKIHDAHYTARQGAYQGTQTWTRIQWTGSHYDVFPWTNADLLIPEPEWPTVSMRELMKVAFSNYLIDTPEHLIVKRLQGRA
jgi:hypothetical protein